MESAIYEQLAQYVRLKYPTVSRRMHFDMMGVNNPSKYTRSMYGRLNMSGWPDFLLAHSAMMPGSTEVYFGLFLEIKRAGTRLKTKDGRWASRHIAEQAEVLIDLQEAGHVAQFACGIDECMQLVDSYMSSSVPIPEPGPFDKAGFLKAAKKVSPLFDDGSTF